MNFYTNVQLVGNTILYRGYEGGEKVTHRDSFSPTLFVSSKKKTKYTTLDGQCVKPIKFDSVRDARDFAKKYEDIDEFGPTFRNTVQEISASHRAPPRSYLLFFMDV